MPATLAIDFVYTPKANNYYLLGDVIRPVSEGYYCNDYVLVRWLSPKFHYICYNQTACPACSADEYLYLCGYDAGLYRGECVTCTVCDANSYRVGCDDTHVGRCIPCGTSCIAGRYASGCTLVSSGLCYSCDTCPKGQYKTGCGGTSIGVCSTCSQCTAGYYTSSECSGMSDTICSACTY